MNSVTNGKVLTYLVLIFAAGAAVGVGLTLQSTRQRDSQPPSMEKACHRFQDRLVSKLELTPAQVQQLQPVFEETTRQLRRVHARAIREGDEIIRHAYEQIGCELTPAQKERLMEAERERAEWLRKRLKDRERTSPTGASPVKDEASPKAAKELPASQP